MVWAKVKITVDHPVFVATENIPAGTVIREEQIRTTNTRQFPFTGAMLDSAGEIIGKVARRAIPSGQRFVAGALDEAKDVAKGDIVHVRVIDGLATLSFDGIAQSSGKKGDTVLVHNSASGRNFRAVVEEKGRAVVRPGSRD
jgi:flagella basal body P-ring formation protein FlgA